MSHHESMVGNGPIKIDLRVSPPQFAEDKVGNIPVPIGQNLIIPGQGCFVFEIPANDQRPEKVQLNFYNRTGDTLALVMEQSGSAFLHKLSDSDSWETFNLINDGKPKNPINDGYTSALDENPLCRYWVSIDRLNKRLRFGKGEMRVSTTLLDYEYDTPPSLFTKEKIETYPFINSINSFDYPEDVQPITLWKDPVVSEPPVFVVDSKNYTLNDAAEGKKTTPTSLSPECQIMCGNVVDFELNTPDFPDFAQAIEYSMRTEGCIGNKILNYKIENSPFEGGGDSEYKELYLRITLGNSQGESPGIPYVLEIWPVGCASPVHHHGYTHAVIKVLRGEIDVDLYRMLPSKTSSNDPLDTVSFGTNDVTYLMPEVNQFHLLKNNLKNTDTCMTIQCYSYSKNDDTHYSTFDYVEGGKVDHFNPISDYDFLDFKAKVKEEWTSYLETRFWMK